MPQNRLQKKDFSIHSDSGSSPMQATTPSPGNHTKKDVRINFQSLRSTLRAPAERALTITSTGTLNSMNGQSPAQEKQDMSRSSTIRSVPSFEASDSSPESKNSGFSSSVHSDGSTMSAMGDSQHEQHPSPRARLSPSSSRLKREPSFETPSRWAAATTRVIEPAAEVDVAGEAVEGDAQWDSTIGKAGLGKTGRVINRLVSDNEALKRDIQIERLRSEEAKSAAKLIEDKMERMVNEYESRLLEANVTKTLLARKERQVETLQAAVELEKHKTADAQDKERSWRSEMDKLRTNASTQVEEATGYAALMEGRYNAISSHWRDQGSEVNRVVSKLREEMQTLVKERRKDDEKIQTLRDLCDQQDGNIRQLRREKEEISKIFDEYKQQQEDLLRDIKTNAKLREDEQEKMLMEAKETLDKLRWALSVKQNVKGAQ